MLTACKDQPPPILENGTLVFVRVWPAFPIFAPNGRVIATSDYEPTKWQAYGYKHISHFFNEKEGSSELAFKIISDAEGKRNLPLGGLIIDHGAWHINKNYTSYMMARFYKILVAGSDKPLWFPDSDVSVMTKEAYEEFLTKLNKYQK